MLSFASAILSAGLGAAAAGTIPPSEGYVAIEPGVRLHYVRLGNGRQIVVSPMGSWLAGPLAPLSRGDRTLILYDTRGRGRSDRVDPPKVSFADEISDLDAVRRHFSLESMALMGWSHYGMMTAVYAIRNPGRVTRLVQITPGGPASDPYLEQGMKTMRSRVDGAAYEALQEKKKAGAFDTDPAGYCRALAAILRPAFFANSADAAKMSFDACALETEWPENQDAWWNALFSSMTPWDYRVQAKVLKVPRLVIQGEKDFIPLEGSREWVAGNPNARLLLMKGVGHHPFVENPTGFLAAVETFLDGEWPEGAVEVPAADAPKNASDLIKHARAAYDRGDRAAFLKDYEEAARLRPGDVYILYNLACAQSINGQGDAALRTLRDYAAHRVAADLDADGDFDAIRKTEGYAKVLAGMNALRKERISSGATVAFTIPEKELAPEGVAYDPATKSFFVASVRKGKVVRVGPDGKASDFVPPGSGLRSALGMGVDPKRRVLWVASAAIPMMNGAREGDPPNSALRLELAPDGLRIAGSRILEMNHPAFDEPTLGAVVDGALYFSANNQGHRFYDAKNPPKPEDLHEAVILKLPVPAAAR